MRWKKGDPAEFLQSVGGKKGQALVVSELLEALMGVWGGPQAFAKAFFTEYNASKQGGMIRARMLADVFRLFVHHTSNMKGKEVPLDSMTEPELRQAVNSLIGKEE